MSDLPNLRDVEKRTIQLTAFEDGLWDLLMGAVIMLLALYPITRELLGPVWNLVLFLVVLMALVGIQLTVRRYLTEPRIGLAKSRRTPALKLALIATIILVALTLGLVILTLIGPGWLPNLGDQELLWGYAVDIAVMVVNVCLFSLLGYLFGVPRLYLYGWLFGGGNLASVVLEDKYELAFNLPLAIAAGIILAIGVVLLRQFVQRYPMRMDEA